MMGGEIHVRSKPRRDAVVGAVVVWLNCFFLGEVGGDNIWVGCDGAGSMI